MCLSSACMHRASGMHTSDIKLPGALTTLDAKSALISAEGNCDYVCLFVFIARCRHFPPTSANVYFIFLPLGLWLTACESVSYVPRGYYSLCISCASVSCVELLASPNPIASWMSIHR